MRLFARRHHQNRRPWDSAPPWALELREMLGLVHEQLTTLLKQANETEKTEMATKETLDALKATIAANTSVTAAATDALNHYAQSNADLTKQLQDAIANSAASDDADVKAAIDAINTNNAALTAAVPAVVGAVVANTPAAPGAGS